MDSFLVKKPKIGAKAAAAANDAPPTKTNAVKKTTKKDQGRAAGFSSPVTPMSASSFFGVKPVNQDSENTPVNNKTVAAHAQAEFETPPQEKPSPVSVLCTCVVVCRLFGLRLISVIPCVLCFLVFFCCCLFQFFRS